MNTNADPKPYSLGTLTNSPLFLLCLTGALLGGTLPMSRVAFDLGWSPVAFVFWSSLGAGLLLLATEARGIVRLRLSPPILLYCLLCGILTVAIPNSVMFIAISKLGTTLTALLYTLPALFTYLFAWMLGMERFHPVRLTGIVIGLAGAATLAYRGGPGGDAGSTSYWLALAMCIPLSLAAGNIYRKLRFPAGVSTKVLAGGMLLGGAAALLPILLLDARFLPTSLAASLVALVQCILVSLGFVVYFRFQRVADPVYFSQLGYVMAATGVLAGIVFFKEQPTVALGIGVVLIVFGVVLVNRRSASSESPAAS
jgi:drug/metabolite transporter (DMT)-like permease